MSSRYLPQTRLPEIGPEGQQRLGKSRILIVGCGALGSPVAMYLAGAGVGDITLADFDSVDISNLHRQVFYRESETGEKKAEILSKRVEKLNSNIRISVCNQLVRSGVLESLSSEKRFDLIVDAADNPATTYLLDQFCRDNHIPFITAGISGWTALVFTSLPGSFFYSDVFSRPLENIGVLPCSLTGIIGPAAAFAASIQSSEALKVLLGLSSKSSMISADLLTMEISTVC